MSELSDLKQVERESFLIYFNDGILELVVGIIMVGIYGCLQYDIPPLIGVWAAVGLPLWALMKRLITAQRVGIVNFKGESERRHRRSKQLFRLGLGAFMITGLLVFLLLKKLSLDFHATFQALPMAPFYLIGIMGLVILAWNFRMNRYWYLALLVFLVASISPLLNSDGLLGFLLLGIVFMAIGLNLLVKFLRTYPKPKLEL